MSIDLSYYDDKFPYKNDVEFVIDGVKNTVGKHSYGIELISSNRYDPIAEFHIGRFCAIAHTEFYLGGSKDIEVFSTAFFMPKFFEKTTYGKIVPSGRLADTNIYIGNDVWIGNNSTIMHGVKIESGAVIAANAHVVSNVPSYAVYGGNPAKLIKYRFKPEIVKLLLSLAWWELDDNVINEIIPILTTIKPNESFIYQLLKLVESEPRSKSVVDIHLKKYRI